jgi:hypothetical protein
MSTGTGQTEQWLGHAVFLVQPNVQTTTSNVVSSFGEQLSVSRRYTAYATSANKACCYRNPV